MKLKQKKNNKNNKNKKRKILLKMDYDRILGNEKRAMSEIQ